MDQAEAHRRYFDARAGSYDSYTAGAQWTPNDYLAGVLQMLVAAGVQVRRALDLGTGTGQSLQVVQAAFPDASLSASDVSPAMLQHAEAKVPEATFEVADVASHLARLTESFDLITAVGCLELVEDLPAVLPELIRHLHPGGHLAFTVEALIDGLGLEQVRLESPSSQPDEPRWCQQWSTARLLDALPGGQLIASHLFTAYYRADEPVCYELFLIRRTD